MMGITNYIPQIGGKHEQYLVSRDIVANSTL